MDEIRCLEIDSGTAQRGRKIKCVLDKLRRRYELGLGMIQLEHHPAVCGQDHVPLRIHRSRCDLDRLRLIAEL